MLADFKETISSFDFIAFQDGGVLFNELDQSVLILNQSAAFIWCAAFEVNTFEQLVAYIAEEFSVSSNDARKDIELFLKSFQSCCFSLVKEDDAKSFLRPIRTPPKPSGNSFDKSRALNLIVNRTSIQFFITDQTIKKELIRIFDFFIRSSEVSSRLEISHSVLVRSDENTANATFSLYVDKHCVFKSLPFNGVIPYLFGIIFETVWKSTERKCKPVIYNDESGKKTHSLMFHAAVSGCSPEKMIMFPAVSGAGKSTLAAMLAAKGWSFFTDELAIIYPEVHQVLSCPLPICVKEGAVDVLSEFYPDLSNLMQHHRLDNKRARYLPVDNAVLSVDEEVRADIIAIVFPHYDKEVICQLEPVNKQYALEQLLECGSSGRPLNREELGAIMGMIEKLPCYCLKYSDIDRAESRLEVIIESQ